MKPTIKTDIQCLDRIIKHITSIHEAFTTLNVSSLDDYLQNNICQLATAQVITNIHELKNKLRDETLAKLTQFSSIRTQAARNIASHDYDRLDFRIIYDRAKQLQNSNIADELERVRHDLLNDSECN